MKEPFTWSEFLTFEVIRGEWAEVIIGHTDDERPVRLTGFRVDPQLTDFEVIELAWDHYREMLTNLNG